MDDHGEGSNASEEEKRQLRRRIRFEQRQIISETHRNRDEITLSEQLVQRVDQLDSLLDNVEGTREAAIDSEGFRLLSAIGREQVEATHGNLIQFDTSNYAEKLVTFMGGRRAATGGQGPLNWAKLGDRAAAAFHRPPASSFLFGAMELEPVKKRRQIGVRKKDKEGQGAAAKPKEVLNLKEDEESTTKDVQHILIHVAKACKVKGRVGYFQFLVDPESFARTVENMFHFSFLIKDGRTGVHLAGDGVPYIYMPTDSVDERTGQSTKTTKNQVIVSLTIADWKRAIAKFKITSASIPQRE